MAVRFGWNITQDFCVRNGLDLVVRSHQSKKWGLGFDVMHNESLECSLQEIMRTMKMMEQFCKFNKMMRMDTWAYALRCSVLWKIAIELGPARPSPLAKTSHDISCTFGPYLYHCQLENVRMCIKPGKWLGAIKTCLESLVP